MKKGWIETPTHPKDPILTDYRVVSAPEAALLLKSPPYAKTPFRGQDLPRTLGHLLRSSAEDLVAGKLRYCSQDPLRDGMFLEVTLFLADYHCKLKFLLQTKAVGFGAEMKEMVFSVGMMILAVNRGDLDLFSQIIENRKKKA
jgi:hypothetical protein